MNTAYFDTIQIKADAKKVKDLQKARSKFLLSRYRNSYYFH